MFDSICREGSLNPLTGFTSLLASMIVHAAVVGLMVVLPLFFMKVLPLEPLIFVSVPLPMPVMKIPSPVHPSGDTTVGRPFVGTPVFRTAVAPEEMSIPPRIPRGIPAPPDEAPVYWRMPGGDGGSLVLGTPSADAGIAWPTVTTDPPPLPEPPGRPAPVRIGTLEPSKILFKASPVYPRLAFISRVEGIVRLEALIDEYGNVTEVTVLEGHTILVDEAVRAVKQWKYTPTIQNGEPVPVLATIKVKFKLR